MEPQNLRFGGGAAESTLHPAVAVALGVAIVLILFLPRKRIITPILLMAFLVPYGQVVVIGGVHFMVLRILMIVSWVRVLARPSKEKLLAEGGTGIDWAYGLWAFFAGTTFMLLYMEKQAVINHVAFLIDAFGGYFLLRYLIRDEEDIRRATKVFALIAAVMAACMISEQMTKHNVFGLVGGHLYVAEIREGRVRSQGVFQHPLLAGAFGATLLPLFAGLCNSPKAKRTALAGIVSCVLIVLTTWTSTPYLACAAGILALCLWPMRKMMRWIRWGIAGALVGLHMVMKAPVWALIARMTVMDASSGDHRYRLVDNFIRRFSDWWLLGARDYGNWGWDMWDLSNGYVWQGLGGGLVSLVCFVAVIVVCFSRIGSARKAVEGDRKREWFFWSLGAALFAHAVALFGTGYWDQTQFAWLAFVAMISAATSDVLRTPATEVRPTKDALAGLPTRLGQTPLSMRKIRPEI